MKHASLISITIVAICVCGSSIAMDATTSESKPASCCSDSTCETDVPDKVFTAEGVGTFTRKLFDTSDFPARWYCGDWSTDVGWLHIASDFGIFSAYFTIPMVLLFFMRQRKDLPFPKVIWLFAAFILACGLGHLVEAGIFWWPVYRFSGLLKCATAIISWATVFVLIRVMPQALKLPSAALLTDKLLKSQERLDIALEAAEIGVWEIKLSDNSVTCDARTREIFGFQSESECATLDAFFNVIHPEDQERVHEAIRTAGENDIAAVVEYRALRSDGSVCFVRSHGKTVWGKENTHGERCPELLVGVSFDITEKQLKDKALLESEQNFRGTFDNAAIGIALLSLDGRWRRVNPGLCKIVGYTSDELLLTTSHLLTHPDDVELDLVHVRGVLAGEFDSYCIEKRHIRKDGSPVWVKLTASVVRNAAGEPTHFVKVIEDIDARKQTELELQRYHDKVEKLSLVASKTQHSVIITDANGYVEWINDAFVQLTGFDLESILGKRPGDFLQGAETDPDCVAKIRASLAARESIATEIVNYRRGGDAYWIELKIDPVLNEAGELTNFIGTQVDITERKRAEESLRKAIITAEEASRAKSEFLATMSHELRTPLNGVIGMTELLAESKLDPRQKRFVSACKKSGQSLLCLINDILDFSKIEAGKLEFDRHPFDLLQLINDTAESMAYRVEEKGLQLNCRLRHPVTMCLSGDSGRLRQVVINLLGNAVKFTHEGLVSVDVEPTDFGENRVTLLFRVKDTGIGIPDDRLKRLFKEFSQVHASTNRQFGGTGLGLSISKNIVEAMEGTIGVRSAAGLGSEFWFELTLERVPFDPCLLPVLPNDLMSLRVLATDENQETREFLQEIFNAWGMHVDTFDSLSAMHDFLDSGPPAAPYDLWIVDETLLKSDTQLQSVLAGEPSLHDARVFSLTPHQEAVGKPLKQVASCIRKPFGPSTLLDRMAETFRRNVVLNPLGKELTNSPRQINSNEASVRSLRILLAEDNLTNQLFAEEILTRQGWQCTIANNGLEALHAVEKQSFDVVLMDCQMPEMDGFEATRKIREFEKTGVLEGHLRIIALTANAIKGDREKCIAAGMDEYLSKPFAPKSLTELILKMAPVEQDRSDSRSDGQEIEQRESQVRVPIDEKVLVENRCMGDIDFALSLLGSFTTNSSVRLGEILEHSKSGDLVEVGKAAHSLKGIAGIIAAERLSDLAAEVESAGKANDIATIQSTLDALTSEVDACLAFIESYKERAHGNI